MNHKPKKMSIFGILVLVVSLFMTSISSVVKASQVTITGNTAQDAVIKDKNGKVVSSNDKLNEYVGYNVTYDWSIPNGTSIKDGDTATFELPSNVKMTHDVSFDVYYKGNVIGSFKINKGETEGTLTFNDYLQNHKMSNVKGTITFGVNGTSSTASHQDWHINKVSWIDQSTGHPTWNISVNPQETHYDRMTVADIMSNNQRIDESTIEVSYGHYDEDGNFITDRVDKNFKDYMLDGNKITFNFTDVNETVNIRYQTIPNDESGKAQLTNQATLIASGSPDQENNGNFFDSANIYFNGNGNITGDLDSSSSSSSSSSEESSSSSVESSSSSSVVPSSSSTESSSSKESSSSSSLEESSSLVPSSSKESSSSSSSIESSSSKVIPSSSSTESSSISSSSKASISSSSSVESSSLSSSIEDSSNSSSSFVKSSSSSTENSSSKESSSVRSESSSVKSSSSESSVRSSETPVVSSKNDSSSEVSLNSKESSVKNNSSKTSSENSITNKESSSINSSSLIKSERVTIPVMNNESSSNNTKTNSSKGQSIESSINENKGNVNARSSSKASSEKGFVEKVKGMLPQTGSESNILIPVLGIILLLAAVVILKKKN